MTERQLVLNHVLHIFTMDGLCDDTSSKMTCDLICPVTTIVGVAAHEEGASENVGEAAVGAAGRAPRPGGGGGRPRGAQRRCQRQLEQQQQQQQQLVIGLLQLEQQQVDFATTKS